jgi:hypothetical protein
MLVDSDAHRLQKFQFINAPVLCPFGFLMFSPASRACAYWVRNRRRLPPTPAPPLEDDPAADDPAKVALLDHHRGRHA